MILLEPGPVDTGGQYERKEYIWLWNHGCLSNPGDPRKPFFQCLRISNESEE